MTWFPPFSAMVFSLSNKEGDELARDGFPLLLLLLLRVLYLLVLTDSTGVPTRLRTTDNRLDQFHLTIWGLGLAPLTAIDTVHTLE
eukprot:CAMPEP_0175163848 /NCGR_PEP_ID=MMETSP0087-20121206/26023_1 /TAXON_ID=136419 /ORGANISM="Unknown Unknown, Strain D1" /LENGTH=85 /DNA_ID=CAMNT_0016452689 /DNA_START=191 /DNA_END=445 /DNA_ORIENTATION=+